MSDNVENLYPEQYKNKKIWDMILLKSEIYRLI